MALITNWSQAFDIMWNNIMSSSAPGILDEEKVTFLNQAQIEIVKEYFSSNANAIREGVDDSSRRQGDFATLIQTTKSTSLPADLMFILDETATFDGITCAVLPISWQEYERLLQRPYKLPPKGQVWRLIESSKITLIPASATDYRMRYVSKPEMFTVLDSGTISGTNLPEHLHDEILQKAVMLAKVAWVGSVSPKGQNVQ